MTAHVPAIPNFLPIGPVLFGMFLGWRSHRAAVRPALGVFLLVYFIISAITGRPPANDAFGQVFYPAVTVLPPVNFIILTFLADQDFFTPGLIAYVHHFGENWSHLLAHFIQWAGNWSHLPQPTLIVFAISFALLIERLFVTTSAELIGALTASVGALHFIANRFVINAFLTVAVETLTLALIKNAYRISFFNKLIRIPEQRAYERHEVVLKLIRYLHILHRSLQKIQRYARP
jgi:hypothetical protein